MLAALAVVLSVLEGWIPPLPGMPPGSKLGLSNLATMYTAFSLGPFSALAIAMVKGVFVGVTRGAVAMGMSLCGGLLSAAVMSLLLKLEKPFGWVGIGVAGALCHNGGQLLLAYLITGPAVVGYAPFLILFALPTGALTGLALGLIAPRLAKLEGRFFL
nr:Gx transporter family protein [uncultured Solibaculum sp.]